MAWVAVADVTVNCQNPAPLNTDFSFQVSFNCWRDLEAPLSWRLVYVGDAQDKSKDQELEVIELGPVKRGALKFTFQSDPPDFSKIDPEEVWGTTVLLLEATYRDKDFVRIGWYIHNYYTDPVLQEDPPDVPQLDQMVRYILVDEPRVTRFPINWSGVASEEFNVTALPMPPVEQQQQQQQSVGGDDAMAGGTSGLQNRFTNQPASSVINNSNSDAPAANLAAMLQQQNQTPHAQQQQQQYGGTTHQQQHLVMKGGTHSGGSSDVSTSCAQSVEDDSMADGGGGAAAMTHAHTHVPPQLHDHQRAQQASVGGVNFVGEFMGAGSGGVFGTAAMG